MPITYRIRHIGWWLVWWGVCGWLTGCQTAVSAPTPRVPTPRPLPTRLIPLTMATPTAPVPPTATAVPLPTSLPDTGWQILRPGLEHRALTLRDENGRLREIVTMLRLDPAQYQFRVGYRPGAPQSLADWQTETGALLVVNGGFFTAEGVATGLVVTEGQASGLSYEGFGGMVGMTETAVSLWSLAEQPYTPDETWHYALQSFPILMAQGTAVYTQEDGQMARRTVIGQDGNGRILFLLAPWGSFTLAQLSHFLTASDLGLTTALNLDGGTSTGLLLRQPTLDIPAFTLLPTVILIFPQT